MLSAKFVVHETFPVKASAADELKAALGTLLEATRRAGNLSYEWFESVISPGTFYSIETWTSRAALEATSRPSTPKPQWRYFRSGVTSAVTGEPALPRRIPDRRGDHPAAVKQ